MQYAERISVARDVLARFLTQFSAPRAMSQDARDATFSGYCEAVNKRISAGINESEFRQRLERICEIVADTHETHAWPLRAEFVKACSKAAPKPEGVSEGYKPDPYRIAASRIHAGDAVGDEWLFGRRCRELIEKTDITDAHLKPYRSALFFADRELMGEDVARTREAVRLARHEERIGGDA